MASEYSIADSDVESLARPIIEAHHAHLLTAEITYLFVSPTPTSKGKEVLGKAKRATAREAALLGEPCDFIIELAEDWWSSASLGKRRALLDHELSHLTGVQDEAEDEGTMKWGLRSHDIEEFFGVIERHGSWNESVSEAKRVFEQLSLPLDERPPLKAVGT